MNLLTVTVDGAEIRVDADQHAHVPGQIHLVSTYDGSLKAVRLADWPLDKTPFGARTAAYEVAGPAYATRPVYLYAESWGRVVAK